MPKTKKFEKKEGNGEEIWKKNGSWKSKSAKKNEVIKVVAMEMGKKNRGERTPENKK